MARFSTSFWKKTPFLKLLLALMAGILVQWHFQWPIRFIIAALVTTVLLAILFFLLPFFRRYTLQLVNGINIQLIMFSVGCLLSWHHDIRHTPDFIGDYYNENTAVVAVLDEPLVAKTKSMKANAKVQYLIRNDSIIPVKGNIIIYFKKDTALQVAYGTQIIFNKSLQPIKNSGNPGGFDYKRYCLFQGITHQVYLKPYEFEATGKRYTSTFRNFIYETRSKVLQILRTNIQSKKELSLAEALLIGYKNDLDQSLVQSYTNTGVVHIIAISGLHLGLIYWLLSLLCRPLQKNKKLKWLGTVIIIAGLWLFSLLAGAHPSILRSAVMFSCIVLGESLSKRPSIFNTLAVSAFILLCINPYWLWNVGFQLSYAAVVSIVIFMRPIYNWFYIKNKVLDFIWKLNAVTISAQIFTVPISIYHFHQFPNLFLLTNFVAVPLASIILLGEILLCIFSFWQGLALVIGKLLSLLIWTLNSYIERIEAIRFSLWDGMQISIWQTILLFGFAIAGINWLMHKSSKSLLISLLALTGFIFIRTTSIRKTQLQEKIIVYNVPQKTAIDFVDGRNYRFVGDSSLLTEGFERNFHLKPSRILYRMNPVNQLPFFTQQGHWIAYRHKKILLLDQTLFFVKNNHPPTIDLLIVSKNPKFYLNHLVQSFHIKQVVFDGAVPEWKIQYWKKDCDVLGIPWHDVNTEGAFVMNLN